MGAEGFVRALIRGGMCAERGSDCGGDGDLCEECNCRRVHSHRALWVAPAGCEAQTCSQNDALQLRSSPLGKQPLNCDLHPSTSRQQFCIVTCARVDLPGSKIRDVHRAQILVPALRTLRIRCCSLWSLSSCVQGFGGVQPCSTAAVPLRSRRAG